MTWGLSCRGADPRRASRAVGALLAALACIALPGMARAERVTVTGQTQAVVVSPLSVVKVQDLDFGRIVPRPTAGTVTVDTVTGGCVVTGAIMQVGTCRLARFDGMGTKNMNARISLTSVVDLTGPGQTMVLDNVILGPNSTISLTGNSNANGKGVGLTKGGNGARYSITTNSGIYSLYVGGRLNVNANQAPGVYTGSISITVQYQ